MIGGPGGFKLLTTEIFQLQKMGTESGILRSIGVANFLLLLSIGSVLIIQMLFKQKSMHLVSGKTAKSSLIDLGIGKYFSLAFLCIVTTIFFFLPILSLFYSALSKVQGVLAFSNIGFDNFIRVLTQTEELPRAVGNSLTLGVMEILKIVELDHLKDRMPNQLSGGQQQRVALARGLVMKPKALLLDEPLSNLDAKLREKMRQDIKSLQKKFNLTMVFITHDQLEAKYLSNKVVVMNKGSIEQIGSVMDVFENPKTDFVRDFIS